MASILNGFEYDIFISYRQKDNKGDHWVTEFVEALKTELEATFKEDISIYFDVNPHDGLLETHDVNKSLEGKLKCLIFIPIISQTYCDPKSFAWQAEFCAFDEIARGDQFGRDIKLSNGNVASRILPVKIHDLDAEDKSLIENQIGGVLRAVEFIYREAGVNRPLRSNEEEPAKNQNHTFYRNQVNKVANAVKEIISALKQSTADKSTPRHEGRGVEEKAKTPAKVKVAYVTVGFMVLSALIYAVSQLAASTPSDIMEPEKSIAVLPFVNMSDNSDQDYFSDGITEQIITNLAHIKSLKVIARTSVMKYKKTDKSIAEIGNELSVTHVLEGSIRKSEGRIRVTAQLISVKDETHEWAQDYDRKLADIFTVQDEISSAIATSLQRRLTPSEYESLKSERSANVEAYQHYLKGYFIHGEEYYIKRKKEDFVRAEKEFKAAIELDSGYALAYAGLADLYDTYQNFGTSSRDEKLEYQAMRDKNANHAYHLNPNHPYVITVKSYVFFIKPDRTEADLDSAFNLRRRAFAIAPNNVDVCDPLSVMYSAFGLYNQAIQLRQRCISLDPTFGNYYAELGNLYVNVGELEKAEAALQKAILIQPEGIAGLQGWALVKLLMNDVAEAERTLKKIKETNPEMNPAFLEGLIFAKKGDKEKALSKSRGSIVYIALGMEKEGFDELEKNPFNYLALKNSPFFDPIRNNPRFVAVLDKAKVLYEERLKKYGN